MKKFLSLALVLMMLLSVLTACGGDNSSDNSGSNNNSNTGSSDNSGGGGNTNAGDSSTAGGGAIGSAGSPVEVHVMVKDVFPSEEDTQLLCMAINEKMAEQGMYVSVIFDEPPASGYASALPLAVMNGEVTADLIYFQGGDQAVTAQGFLEDLTPYIAGSTYVKNLMDESNVQKLASYPYLLWLSPPRINTPGIRTDWTEQLSTYDALIADPTTDNYLAFFKDIKDTFGAYALTSDGQLARFDSIFNHAFGVTGTVIQEDGQWIFSKASQAEKAKLEFYAKLFAEGYIDPNYSTNDWSVAEQNFYDGKVGIYSGTAGATFQVYDTKMTSLYGDGAALTVLPPAKGVSQSYTSVDVTKEARGIGINVDSQNKDAAWAVLEFMASPEGRILDKVGIEGVHYNIEGNQIVFTDKFSSWWARFWDTVNKFDPEPPLAQWVLTDAAQKSLDMVNEYMVMDTNLLIPDEMTPQWDAMTQLYNEYAYDIIHGERPVSDFDEFVEKWNAAGGDQFAPILAETFG